MISIGRANIRVIARKRSLQRRSRWKKKISDQAPKPANAQANRKWLKKPRLAETENNNSSRADGMAYPTADEASVPRARNNRSSRADGAAVIRSMNQRQRKVKNSR